MAIAFFFIAAHFRLLCNNSSQVICRIILRRTVSTGTSIESGHMLDYFRDFSAFEPRTFIIRIYSIHKLAMWEDLV